MCGIAGVIGACSPGELEAMTGAQAHRGPDGSGHWHDPELPAHLGHRRLAILDLSEAAGQPMLSADGQLVIVFNGEIYNHMELRRELESLGHVFRTSHSDTEALLLGYRQWGEDLPRRCNGMFAFAVLDRARRRVFLARDRFGEKPLFYSLTPRGLAFASEMQALARWSGFNPAVSTDNLQRYFAWGYFTGGRTLFSHVFNLRPGHSLTVDLSADGVENTRIACWWRFTLEPDPAWETRPEEELVEELRALILQAVERRLISDVPLGVFLSGGIDSSTVLAAMCRLRDPTRVRAFTVGFTEPSFDESPHAAAVAARCGVEHHLERLDMERAAALIPRLLDRVGEPLGDASLLPTWLLSRFTRRNVTVALSGDAGDELLAGYDPFLALRPALIYSRFVPGWLHDAGRWLAEKLPPGDANMSLDFKIKRTLRGLSQPRNFWLPAWMGPLGAEDMGDLFARPLSPEALYADVANFDGRDPVEETLLAFTRNYLADDILTKVDRAAMLESLESRAVFLDNDFVDFCRRLPQCWKLRGKTRKYLLRRAVFGWLPKEILERPKKGFGIPLNKWLRDMDLNLPQVTLPGVRGDYVRRAEAEHHARRGDHRAFLWAWLSMEHALRCCGVGDSSGALGSGDGERHAPAGDRVPERASGAGDQPDGRPVETVTVRSEEGRGPFPSFGASKPAGIKSRADTHTRGKGGIAFLPRTGRGAPAAKPEPAARNSGEAAVPCMC